MAKKENVYTGGTPNFDERTGTMKKPKLIRLSPGVYRNQSGDLVGSGGQKIPRAGGRSPSIFDSLNTAAPISPGQSQNVPPMSADLQRVLDTWAKNMGSAKPVTPEQRPGLGIDPRDPNQYAKMPDGSLFGTYMGWYKSPGEADRAMAAARLRADMQTPQIPKATALQELIKRMG